jgi:plasmid recombination enzyme
MSKGGKNMSEELAYSIHLGSDKNKTAKAKEIAKNNSSGETSFSNNGIQNATQLSKVNKHNLRNYDNDKENIQIIYGTDNLYKDMQDLYFQEFEQARIEYNNKQTREDRKIKDYFKHISQDKQKDLACEFIIELGDMDFWNKDDYYKRGMTQVYKEQVRDLIRIVPEFKVANAVILFDETSPHMHIVGVPIKEDYKRGMKKQPAKSRVFTKESLQQIQDEMRICCIKSYNKVYCENSLLKQKKKGRNRDIDIKYMGDYREIKRQLEKKEERLKEANTQTKKIDNTSKDIDKIFDSLKSTLMNKNNMVISNEDVQKIKNYTEDVKEFT